MSTIFIRLFRVVLRCYFVLCCDNIRLGLTVKWFCVLVFAKYASNSCTSLLLNYCNNKLVTYRSFVCNLSCILVFFWLHSPAQCRLYTCTFYICLLFYDTGCFTIDFYCHTYIWMIFFVSQFIAIFTFVRFFICIEFSYVFSNPLFH